MLLNALDVRRSRAAALAFALGLLAAACEPTLEEGKYSCEDLQCPPHWACNLSNHLCYSKVKLTADESGTSGGPGDREDGGPGTDGGAESDSGTASAGTGSGSTGSAGKGGASGTGAGGSSSGGSGSAGRGGAGGAGGNAGAGGAGGAAGVTGEPYAACEAGASCAAGGACVLAPDDAASHGVCSSGCGSDAECPDNAGQPSACLGGLGKCLPGCADSADCPAGLACHDLAVGMMQTRAVCFDVVSPELLGTAACTPGDMTSCGHGATCAATPNPAGGVCSYRCDTTQSCPAGGKCVEIFNDVHQCLKPCAGSGECGALTCGSLGDMQLCVPAAWAGHTLPLPPPPM